MVVVERRFFGSAGEWIPAKIRRCWSVWIPSKAIIFPVRVLSKICICGRRRTLVLRLRWRVDSREDKALLVSLDTFRCPASCFNIVDGVRRFRFEGDNLPREGLDEDLHAKIRRCWLV